MIIDDNRQPFDDALADPSNTFLLLFGANNPAAEDINRVASDPEVVEDWNKVVLFHNPNILTADEKQAWYVGDDKYTTLSRNKADLPNKLPTPHSRKIVEQDFLTALCTQGAASPRKISAAFGRADRA